MKRQIITLMLAIVAVLTASAQKKMVIVVDGQEQTIGEVWRIDEIKFIPTDVVTLTDDPDSLELGLEARWADRNMGAASPKDMGRLIGWGDTTLTNYSTKLQYFPIENVDKDIAGGNYDVAKQKWASKWHMPTEAEIQELIEACDWTWVNDADNDSVGVVGTLKTDETKTIFFPVTGYREGEADPAEAAKGYYWTGSLAQTSTECARFFSFSEDAPTPVVVSDKKRYIGMAIRPVLGQLEIPTTIESVTISGVTDKAASVVVTLAGSLKDVTLAGLAYGKSNNLSTSDTDDNSHQVLEIGNPLTFPFDNLEHNTTYYVMAYVKKNDGSYLTYTIMSFTTEQAQNFPVAEAVDMGLPSGTKWASWNMGASSPKEVPTTKYARYGWGDPTGEVHHDSDNSHYAVWQNASLQSGNVIDIAGTEYDIAHVQWGDKWQLPSEEDFNELGQYGRWEVYYDNDNQRGYKVTSRINDNVIYIPAAGIINSSFTLRLAGGDTGTPTPIYWTSSNVTKTTAKAIRPSEGSQYSEPLAMYCEASIRPVYKDNSSSGSGGNTIDDSGNTGGNTGGDDGGNTGGETGEQTEPESKDAGNAVDLGLSVKWADRNVGAASESGKGYYIAFGDTIPRDEYLVYSYIHYDNATQSFTTQDMYPLTSTYDAAHYQWGGNWRMPTYSEWSELMTNCDWVWESTGFRVYKKNSRNKSESIFIPAGGLKLSAGDQVNINFSEECWYWTSQWAGLQGKEREAQAFRSTSEQELRFYNNVRWAGLLIRPVMP